jgi:glycopeptide antibiotics resistance protein
MIVNVLFLFSYGILKNEKKVYNSNIIIYIFLFIYLLFTFTFLIGRTEFKFYNWWYAGQYTPFNTIVSQFKYGSTSSILKNVIGNSIMMIPMSFLLMIRNKKFNNIFWQSLITLPMILIIEVLQASTHTGAFDIDDIILNYFGTVIFTFIITRFGIIDKIRNFFYTDFKINLKVKRIAFYICLSILVIFDVTLFIK